MQQNFTIMKKIIILTLMAVVSIAASAQTKKVSILGDSYSTFQGVGPSHYAPFYPNDRNDVKEVDQTWWSLFIKAKGYQLEKNDSWGGTTICGTGYGRMDSSRNNFISRVDSLGNPVWRHQRCLGQLSRGRIPVFRLDQGRLQELPSGTRLSV